MIEVRHSCTSFSCNCCGRISDFELKYGSGVNTINVTIIRLCKSCANTLLEELYYMMGNVVHNKHQSEVYKEPENNDETEEDFSVAVPSEDKKVFDCLEEKKDA